jgi:hypothetical protein
MHKKRSRELFSSINEGLDTVFVVYSMLSAALNIIKYQGVSQKVMRMAGASGRF